MSAPHVGRLEFATPEERAEYARFVGMLQREWGEETAEAVVLRALREAASRT